MSSGFGFGSGREVVGGFGSGKEVRGGFGMERFVVSRWRGGDGEIGAVVDSPAAFSFNPPSPFKPAIARKILLASGLPTTFKTSRIAGSVSRLLDVVFGDAGRAGFVFLSLLSRAFSASVSITSLLLLLPILLLPILFSLDVVVLIDVCFVDFSVVAADLLADVVAPSGIFRDNYLFRTPSFLCDFARHILRRT